MVDAIWITSRYPQALAANSFAGSPRRREPREFDSSIANQDCFSSVTMVIVPLMFSTRTLTLSPS